MPVYRNAAQEEEQERKRQRSSPSSPSHSVKSKSSSPYSSSLLQPTSSSSSVVFTLLPLESWKSIGFPVGDTSLTKGRIPSHSQHHIQEQRSFSPSPVHFGVEGARIGRDLSVCNVTFPSWNGISRLHCVISVVGVHVHIRDLSLNGTFVNGRLVGHGKTVELVKGDMISVCNPFLPHSASYTYIFLAPPLYQKHSLSSPLTTSLAIDSLSSLFPHYSFGVVVGQGVFANIYRATDTRTGDEVAIKVLKKQHFSMDVFETSLRLEAEVLRSLQHPHIIQLLDTITAPGFIALVMELVPGGDLFDCVVSRGASPFSEEEARFLFHQIVEAVRYMHSKNIIHCDLKPENVVIALSSGPNSTSHRTASCPSHTLGLPGPNRHAEHKPMMKGTPHRNSSTSAFIAKESLSSTETPLLPSALPHDSSSTMLFGQLSEDTPTMTSCASSNLTVPLHPRLLPNVAEVSPFYWQLKLIDFGVAQYFQNPLPSSKPPPLPLAPLPDRSQGDHDHDTADTPCAESQDDNNNDANEGRSKKRSLRMVIPTIGTPAYAAPELISLRRSGLLRPVSSHVSLPSLNEPQPSSTSAIPEEKKSLPNSAKETETKLCSMFSLSPALDMWSLGVLLYILCSGCRPKKRAHISDPLVFHKHMAGLSLSCKALLRALLSMDPTNRMTMKELLCNPWWKAGGIHFTSPVQEEKGDEFLFPSGTSSPTSPRYAMSFSSP